MHEGDRKIVFGEYSLNLDNGLLYIKNEEKNELSIIGNMRVGVRDLHNSARLYKAGKNSAYLLDKELSHAVLISFSKTDKELSIEIEKIGLDHKLSGDFMAVSDDGNLLLVDIGNKKYVFIANGQQHHADIDIADNPTSLILGSVAMILSNKQLYIIKNGQRSLIELRHTFNLEELRQNYKKDKDSETIYLSDGKYEIKFRADAQGNVLYGERVNEFYGKKD
jgi:hypothetical protein